MKAPTYTIGQLVSLRWEQDPHIPGIYLLLRANGSPQGTTWEPTARLSMALPRRLTLWAEIIHCHAELYTLQIPSDLGLSHVILPREELASCDVTTPAEA